jgi:alpha-galactosidase
MVETYMHVGWIKVFYGLVLCAIPMQAPGQAGIKNSQVRLSLSCGAGCLWAYGTTRQAAAYHFSPPTFSVDGKQISAGVHGFTPVGTPKHLDNGATEYLFSGTLVQDSHLQLLLQFQINENTPVIRFRYMLKADQPRTLSGANSLIYLQTSFQQLPQVEEVTLSNFAQLTHSYTLYEQPIEDRYFQDSGVFMGPILAASDGHRSFLLGYEHGSQFPDAFLHYQLGPGRSVRLSAVKGNYVSGQRLDGEHPFQTIWMETAATRGGIDQLASTYRQFVLK